MQRRDRPKPTSSYYRWTGVFIYVKRTTKTLTSDDSLECKKRIKNFRHYRSKFNILCGDASPMPLGSDPLITCG